MLRIFVTFYMKMEFHRVVTLVHSILAAFLDKILVCNHIHFLPKIEFRRNPTGCWIYMIFVICLITSEIFEIISWLK